MLPNADTSGAENTAVGAFALDANIREHLTLLLDIIH